MRRISLLYLFLMLTTVSFSCGLNLADMGVPFIPTQTLTPTATKIPTPTPTYPPKFETSGTTFSIEVRENGTTLFFDNELGYQLEFSPEWLLVPNDESSWNDALAVVDQTLSDATLEDLNQVSNLAGLRLVALDYTMAFSNNEPNMANVIVSYQPDPAIGTYELADLLDDNASTIPTLVPGTSVSYQDIRTNSNGVEYAKMIIDQPASDSSSVDLRQVALMVKLDEGLLVITCTVEEELYTSAEPVFQRLFDSLAFLKQ